MADLAIDRIVRPQWPDLWVLLLMVELPGDGPGAMAPVGLPARFGAPEAGP